MRSGPQTAVVTTVAPPNRYEAWIPENLQAALGTAKELFTATGKNGWREKSVLP